MSAKIRSVEPDVGMTANLSARRSGSEGAKELGFGA